MDRYGNLVFRKECLDLAEDRFGKMVQAEVPFVFRDRNKGAREKAKERHMVMLDASQFLKEQLEYIQEKMVQHRDHDDEGGEEVESEEGYVREVEEPKEREESDEEEEVKESIVDNQIMMFNNNPENSPSIM